MKKKIIILSGFIFSLFLGLSVKASSFFERNIMESMQPSLVGRYEFAIAGGGNAYLDREIDNGGKVSGTAVRLPNDNGGRINDRIPGNLDPNLPDRNIGGGGNSSSSVLNKPSANAKIVKAYLVEELDAATFTTDIIQTKPMTLKGPKGGTIKSNGMFNTIYSGYRSSEDFDQGTKPMVTVTDVTSFVQAQGFGTYEGWDIPYWIKNKWNSVTDHSASWKLITICEDQALPMRIVSLKYGAVSLQEGAIQLTIEGAGIKTKESGNVTGQILIGGMGGDPGQETTKIQLQPDPSTPYFNLNTGRNGEVNTEDCFLQGIVTVDGTVRSDIKSLGTVKSTGLPYQNNDLILMNTNSRQSNAQNGHNAYFKNNSSKITLQALNKETSTTITVLGMIADIDVSTYAARIAHDGQAYQDKPLAMSAHLENNSSTSKMNQGMSGGYAVIQVDPNIQLNTNSIGVTFTDKSTGRKHTISGGDKISVSGNTITVAFGLDGNRISQVGDQLDVSFTGVPKTVKDGYVNTITMYATGLVDENGAMHPQSQTMQMAYAKDTFNVFFNNPPVINAYDQTFYENQYTDQYWKNILRWKDVSASDVEDGNLLDKVSIKSDNVDVKTPGSYNVTYTVTDSGGKTTEKTVTITVLYNNPPTIEAQDRWFYVSEDVTNERLMEYVKANDIEDGNIKDKAVIIASNVQNHVIGDYEVTYKVTDAYGKSAETTAKIHIVKDVPTGDESNRYLRFISLKYIDTLKPNSVWRSGEKRDMLLDTLNKTTDEQAEEIWVITAEDMEAIKAFNETHNWSAESCQEFREQFAHLIK